MTKRNPIPRKFQSLLEETLDDVCQIAGMAQLAYEMLQAHPSATQYVCMKLQEMKALAYKAKSNLSEIDIATDCTTCPLAPPRLRIHHHLLLFADTLDQVAAELRRLVKNIQ